MNGDLFLKDLESKLGSALKEEEVEKIKKKSFKYLGVNCDVSGEVFFDENILQAAKDYSTDDMRYYQAVKELKGRISSMFESTISLQKKEVEIEVAQLDLEELECKLDDLDKPNDEVKNPALEKKRIALKIKSKYIDINQLRVQAEFLKQKVQMDSREVEDFTNLCEHYSQNGVKPFEQARVEDMVNKKEARYLNYVIHGNPLSPSEIAFYYNKDGVLVPPAGVMDKLLELGRIDLFEIEYRKLKAVDNKHNMLDQKRQIIAYLERPPQPAEGLEQLQQPLKQQVSIKG